MTKQRPTAFVIMPFADPFTAVYTRLIQPALDAYDVIRADSRTDQRAILEKIIHGIHDAELVIADLTTLNPNVMYELGVAHALGKATIMITQQLSDLPFDIRAYPVHHYSTHFEQAAELTTSLRELALKHAEGLLLFGNPVTDFIPSVAEPAIAPHRVTAAHQPVDPSAELAAITIDVRNIFDNYLSLMSTLSDVISEKAPALAAARMIRTPQSDIEAKQIVSDVADAMRSYATDMESLLPRFRTTWDRVGATMLSILSPDAVATMTEDESKSFLETTNSIDKRMSQMLGEVADFKEMIASLTGMTANMSHASEVTQEVLSRLLNELMYAKAHLARIRKALAAVPPPAS